MTGIDLNDKYISFIKETITNILPDVEVFIFGSRTQGKAREYSDVDIALKAYNKIPLSDILKIKTAFEDSTFPYKVDVVDLNSIDEKFYNIIKNDLYKIS